jgi:hypothetical protein
VILTDRGDTPIAPAKNHHKVKITNRVSTRCQPFMSASETVDLALLVRLSV